jgi:transposase
VRFLSDPTVPFTSNLAERNERIMKLRPKTSGSFRSVDGLVDFTLIQSLLSTAKKQGDILQALASQLERLISALQMASSKAA